MGPTRFRPGRPRCRPHTVVQALHVVRSDEVPAFVPLHHADLGQRHGRGEVVPYPMANLVASVTDATGAAEAKPEVRVGIAVEGLRDIVLAGVPLAVGGGSAAPSHELVAGVHFDLLEVRLLVVGILPGHQQPPRGGGDAIASSGLGPEHRRQDELIAHPRVGVGRSAAAIRSGQHAVLSVVVLDGKSSAFRGRMTVRGALREGRVLNLARCPIIRAVAVALLGVRVAAHRGVRVARSVEEVVDDGPDAALHGLVVGHHVSGLLEIDRHHLAVHVADPLRARHRVRDRVLATTLPRGGVQHAHVVLIERRKVQLGTERRAAAVLVGGGQAAHEECREPRGDRVEHAHGALPSRREVHFGPDRHGAFEFGCARLARWIQGREIEGREVESGRVKHADVVHVVGRKVHLATDCSDALVRVAAVGDSGGGGVDRREGLGPAGMAATRSAKAQKSEDERGQPRRAGPAHRKARIRHLLAQACGA